MPFAIFPKTPIQFVNRISNIERRESKKDKTQNGWLKIELEEILNIRELFIH